jgi:phosphoribosylformylglycinamidine synthase
MSAACNKFSTPVTGGNVSFYNQSADESGKVTPVFPTPTIGMLGILEDQSLRTSLDFKYKGDLIFMIGQSRNDIGSSEYLASYHEIKLSPAPHFDLDEEFRIQDAVKQLIRNNFINAAHDVADGGLFITLTEMGMPSGLGFDIVSDSDVRTDAFLFGEAQSRVIVTVVDDYEDEFIDFMGELDIPITLLGHVTQGKMCVDGEHYGFIKDAKKIYDDSLAKELQS